MFDTLKRKFPTHKKIVLFQLGTHVLLGRHQACLLQADPPRGVLFQFSLCIHSLQCSTQHLQLGIRSLCLWDVETEGKRSKKLGLRLQTVQIHPPQTVAAAAEHLYTHTNENLSRIKK